MFSKVCAQLGEGAGAECLRCFQGHSNIVPCSPEPAAQGEAEGGFVDLNKHPNPLQFPCVEIEASSPALAEEKEPQIPKSFDLCCHIHAS